MRSWYQERSELRDLRALRGDTMLDHEGREAHEGIDTKSLEKISSYLSRV